MKMIIFGLILWLIFWFWVIGVDYVFVEGGAIFVSNYLLFFDLIFLPLLFDWKVIFFAKVDYFIGRGVKGCATVLFFKLVD